MGIIKLKYSPGDLVLYEVKAAMAVENDVKEKRGVKLVVVVDCVKMKKKPSDRE